MSDRCRQKYRQAEIHQLTDRPGSSHSAPRQSRVSQFIAQIFCIPADASEQDLTVLAPEA
jgi:hypothetical protein